MFDPDRPVARADSHAGARAGLILAAVLLILAGCGPLPPARPAPSGFTAGNGGADAYMHVSPRGMSNFPY